MTRLHRPFVLQYWFDLLVLFVILSYSLLIWLPTLHYPFHWDSAGFVINALEHLRLTHFTPFNIIGSDFAHPPLLIAIWALIWQYTGQSITALHLSMIPFLPLLMFSTYLIGKKCANSTLGILAAFLIGLIPVVVAEYGVIYLDLPSASLSTLAVALFVYRRQWLALIILTLAVLTKAEVGLLLPMLFYWYLTEPGRPKFSLVSITKFLLPPLSLFGWFVYHFYLSGWLIVAPSANLVHRFASNLSQLASSSGFILSNYFLGQFRFILLICVLVSMGYYLYINRSVKPTLPNRYLVGFMISLAIALLFFIIMAEYAARYTIFLLPYYLVASLLIISQGLQLLSSVKFSYTWLSVGSVLIGGCFLSVWYPKIPTVLTYDFRPPEDLSYQDMIHVFRNLGAYLSINESNSQIYGSFPENIYLTQSYQGYVTSPLKFSLCDQFVYNPQVRTLLVVHPYSPGQLDCRQLMDHFTMTPVQKFTAASKWIELYEISATTSATTKT
jgi:hypothetical protein